MKCTLSSRQFEALRDLIYRSLGLHFDDSKVDFLEKRIERRLEALGMTKADDYLFHLRFLDPDGLEMQALANLVTTNETYMFREFEQLQAFADFCLPEAIEQKERAGDRTLRLWSAGCSSGEEAYTLAIILREVMHDADSWDIRILASDIDQDRLRMAERAVYGHYAVREVPEEYAARHLVPEGLDMRRVCSETARLVEFRNINLHDHRAWRSVRGYDFVFCRNVLIYFDEASRRSVVEQFYHTLNPLGFLFLGHSESVSRISSTFRIRRLGPHLVYRKE